MRAQSCLTLCDPMDCSRARLLCPWDSPWGMGGVGGAGGRGREGGGNNAKKKRLKNAALDGC